MITSKFYILKRTSRLQEGLDKKSCKIFYILDLVIIFICLTSFSVNKLSRVAYLNISKGSTC